MRAKLAILFAVAVMLTLLPAGALAHTEEEPLQMDLIAGGGNVRSAIDVGDLLIWNDGETLYVKYLITDGDWCLTETHLQVFLDDVGFTDIRLRNGNPPPGMFEYGDYHDCVDGFTYPIPLTWDPGIEVKIAAHGVVRTGDGYESGLAELGASLPDQVTIAVTHPGLGYGAPSYFDIAVSGGTMLDGTYDGNCADLEGGPPSGTAYPYLSTEPIPDGVVQKPENLDLVNWIINQGFLGQPSACGGAYTWGDVQWAIWKLVDGREPTPGALLSLHDWSLCRAQEIVDAALANGEGFVPGCGDVVGIILAPEVSWTQSVLIWIPVPCAKAETAWGGDYFGTPLEFPGDNWAIYFAYSVQ